MIEYGQQYSEDEISSLCYETYPMKNPYISESDKSYMKPFYLKDENHPMNDDVPSLYKGLRKEFYNEFNNRGEDTNFQIYQQNKKEEHLNISEFSGFLDNQKPEESENGPQMMNDYYYYDRKKSEKEEKEKEKEKEKRKKKPKTEIKGNKINIIEVKEEELIICMNQKRKRENESNYMLQKKNTNIGINTNNKSIKNEIFIVKKINTSEGFKSIIFQYIFDIIKMLNEETEFSKEKDYIKFEDEMNKKLKDVLKPYINKLSLDKMSKEEKKDLEFSTPSKYIKKLLNKTKETNNKRKLNKPELKQIFRIFNAIKKPKKQKKKRKRINDQKYYINMINFGINKDSVALFNGGSLNNNLLNDYSYDSYGLNNFNIDLLGNNKEKNQIFQINSKDKITTNYESNIGSNKGYKSEFEKEEIKFRNDHSINILKNMTIHQFEAKFNLLNKSYKLKIINEKKNSNKNAKNDNDSIKEDDIENIIEDNNEEEDDDEDLKEENNVEVDNYEEGEKDNNEIREEIDNKGGAKIYQMEEDKNNLKEIKEKKEEEIIIYITIKNNNNIRKDLYFMQTSFEKIIKEAKKRQNLEYLEESLEAKNLIIKVKYAFLKEILADKKLSENLFKKIQSDKENLWKTDICRNISYEIVKRKDLDGLVCILLFSEKVRNQNIYYKDKDSFIAEIKKLRGYEELISNYKDINNDIQSYMISLKEMANNMVDYLKNKKEIIEEKEIKKKLKK